MCSDRDVEKEEVCWVGGDLSEIEIAASWATVFARGRARKVHATPLRSLAALGPARRRLGR